MKELAIEDTAEYEYYKDMMRMSHAVFQRILRYIELDTTRKSCEGCKACYVGETSRHISTRIRGHLHGKGQDLSHFHYFQNSDQCRRLSSESCFSILDTAPNRFQLKIEAAHIRWTKPSLNRQLKHAELTLSF